MIHLPFIPCRGLRKTRRLSASVAAFVVLAGWMMAATDVEAACGDYVVVRGAAQTLDTARSPVHAWMMKHGAVGHGATSRATGMNQGPMPCHGPQCRSNPSDTKWPVPPAVTPPVQKYWLTSSLLIGDISCPATGRVLPADREVPSLIDLPPPDHPPRSMLLLTA